MSADTITIRTDIRPGDLGYVMYRHGKLYAEEYDYGVTFETYVGAGLYEFYKNYDPELDRAWICEDEGSIIGFLLLMHREKGAAQLRYFYVEPTYRRFGVGKKLMQLFMNFLVSTGYRSAYLWTTHELSAAASLYTRNGFVLTEEKSSTDFGKSLRERRYDLILNDESLREQRL